MSTTVVTHYDVLGVAEDATFAEIKQAYRRLLGHYHVLAALGTSPDAVVALGEVKAAGQILNDPALRQQYDDMLYDWRAQGGDVDDGDDDDFFQSTSTQPPPANTAPFAQPTFTAPQPNGVPAAPPPIVGSRTPPKRNLRQVWRVGRGFAGVTVAAALLLVALDFTRKYWPRDRSVPELIAVPEPPVVAIEAPATAALQEAEAAFEGEGFPVDFGEFRTWQGAEAFAEEMERRQSTVRVYAIGGAVPFRVRVHYDTPEAAEWAINDAKADGIYCVASFQANELSKNSDSVALPQTRWRYIVVAGKYETEARAKSLATGLRSRFDSTGIEVEIDGWTAPYQLRISNLTRQEAYDFVNGLNGRVSAEIFEMRHGQLVPVEVVAGDTARFL